MKPPFKDYSLGSKFASHYLCLVLTNKTMVVMMTMMMMLLMMMS